jgi:hypothetical protein
MRFHAAIVITGCEAEYLIRTNQSGRASVVSFDGLWYDVRSMSPKELECFIDDLARRRHGRGATLN